MISILVVAPGPESLTRLAGRHPSVEILRARGAEEALEKLGRNRRIDAVLLLAGRENAGIVEEILEDNPAPPPLFLPATGTGQPAGARALPAEDPGELLDLVLAEIGP